MTRGYNPKVIPYGYDPERARALIKAAGYNGRIALTAAIVNARVSSDINLFVQVAQDLRAVGIDLKLNAMLYATWIQRFMAGTFDADLFSLAWNSAPYGDAFRPIEIHSCAKFNPFFCNESAMPLIEDARRNMDVHSRLKTLRKLQVINHENPPAIILLEQVALVGHVPEIGGLTRRNQTIAYEKVSREP